MTPQDMQVFYAFMIPFLGWPLLWALWRLFHPFRCACGRLHWNMRKAQDHIAMKHQRRSE